jgi:hypothetical protein
MVPLFKLHLTSDANYVKISSLSSSTYLYGGNKVIFQSVFDMYGAFEVSCHNSRFAFNIIAIAIILFYMLKRIYFGGFNKNLFNLISFVVCVLFVLENIIYVVLSFLVALFSLFSIACYYKGYKESKDKMLQAKLFIHLIFNSIILVLTYRLLRQSYRFTKFFNNIRKETANLNDTENQEVENNDNNNINPYEFFQYTGKDNQQHAYAEFAVEKHPRFLYYRQTNPREIINGQSQTQNNQTTNQNIIVNTIQNQSQNPNPNTNQNNQNQQPNNNNNNNNSNNNNNILRINPNQNQNQTNPPNNQNNNGNVAPIIDGNQSLTHQNDTMLNNRTINYQRILEENNSLREANRRLNDELIALRERISDVLK